MRNAVALVLAILAATFGPALACDDAASRRALQDAARAQERQATLLARIERLERERNVLLDRAARAERRR